MTDLSPFQLGEVVRRSRRAAKLSQARLAAKAGVRRETVNRIEKGRGCSEDSQKRIGIALGVALSDLNPDDPDYLPQHHFITRNLRDRRRELGLTLSQCAEAAQVSIATLSRFERGATPAEIVRWEWGQPLTICNKGLADILGFASLEEITAAWDVEVTADTWIGLNQRLPKRS